MTTEGIDVRIGDVVMYGERMEPPRFQQVTTDYECRRWVERSSEILAVLRKVWSRKDGSAQAAPVAETPERVKEWPVPLETRPDVVIAGLQAVSMLFGADTANKARVESALQLLRAAPESPPAAETRLMALVKAVTDSLSAALIAREKGAVFESHLRAVVTAEIQRLRREIDRPARFDTCAYCGVVSARAICPHCGRERDSGIRPLPPSAKEGPTP